MSSLFTIGHSNHAIEEFVWMLRSNGVECLADVRSASLFAMDRRTALNDAYEKQAKKHAFRMDRQTFDLW